MNKGGTAEAADIHSMIVELLSHIVFVLIIVATSALVFKFGFITILVLWFQRETIYLSTLSTLRAFGTRLACGVLQDRKLTIYKLSLTLKNLVENTVRS